MPTKGSHGLVDALKADIEGLSEKEHAAFLRAIELHGEDWGYQPSHPIAHAVMNTLVGHFQGQVPIGGIENVKHAQALAASGTPVVMVGNHLSYGDTNFLHSQLALQGFPAYPLLVMAGPKVYREPFRRLSSLAFETIKMAQPPSRASDGADVSMRELAEITRKVMEDAALWQSKGRVLYFFPEGSRTRSGGLERFISASARYCEAPGTVVFPVGFSGTEGLMRVEDDTIQFDEAQVNIGAGLAFDDYVDGLPDNPGERRKVWMDLLGFAVADQLPEKLRGVYGDDCEELKDARQLHLTVSGNP